MIFSQRISPRLSERVSTLQVPVCKQGGFSLIELMVVVAILGILVGVGGTSWSSYREATRVESAKEKVMSIFQQARLKALSSGFSQTLTIDYENDTLTNVSGQTASFEGVDLQKYVATPVCAATDPVGAKTFIFKKRGTVAGNAAVTLKLSLPSSSKAFIIKINNVTGRLAEDIPAC